MIDQLTNIDKKIHHLKKRREKVQTQQAINFMREVQKIFPDGFTPDIALSILSETWGTASQSQKQNWRKRGNTFRTSDLQDTQQKSQTSDPATQQS
ncbi:MAG: hypothetical protein H0X26_08555 [Alphaproteobacteria bacterium]|nr:hypothetical protein [Alphaproteobacteria bacterium]